MAKKLSPFGVDMIKTCTAFGLTLGLQIYIVGVLFGGWLDRRLDAAPAFTLAGILIAIFISFYRLISDFKKALAQEEKREAEKKAKGISPQYINYDEIFAEEAVGEEPQEPDNTENTEDTDKEEKQEEKP